MIGVAVLWFSVGSALLITHFDVLAALPISYLGVYDTSKFLFNGGLILSSLMFIIFARFLNKQLHASLIFFQVFLCGQICQIIVALTPYDSQSIIRQIHVIAAFALAFCLPASMYVFMVSGQVAQSLRNTTKWFFYAEVLLFSAGIGTFIFASTAGALSEIVTAVAFDMWIVWLSLFAASND